MRPRVYQRLVARQPLLSAPSSPRIATTMTGLTQDFSKQAVLQQDSPSHKHLRPVHDMGHKTPKS